MRKKNLKYLALICLFLNACSGSSAAAFEEIVPGSIYTGEISILEPEASGTNVFSDGSIEIDASNVSDGYIMMRTLEPFSKTLKVRITKDNDVYIYTLPGDMEYTVYPLQLGNGNYTINVYQNLEGTQYIPIYTQAINVQEKNDEQVYRYPNQFVWYTHDYPAIQLSYDICDGIESDKEKIQKIYDYVTNYLSYDNEKAAVVEAGYIPNLENVLKEKKGICFDYAALMAAMLRAQNIPTRLVMGNLSSEGIYHAWNEVYEDGKWVWYDPTYGYNNKNSEQDYIDDRRY